jgi:hypothetical protein
VQRSRHLTQADSRIFGAAYITQCSSVDGQDFSSANILMTVTSCTFRERKGSTSKACLTSFQWPGVNPSDKIRTSVSWSRKFNH